MKRAVVINDLLDVLPFNNISWEKFQSFCTDVLYKVDKIVESREYLNQGNAQDGIDIYAIEENNDRYTVAQCKKEGYLSPKDVKDLIDCFLAGTFVSSTKKFILCTSYDLSKHKDEESTIKSARNKLAPYDIQFIVWDERGLSTFLRTTPKDELIHIVTRYFGVDIASSFYGDAYNSYIQKLAKIPKKQYKAPIDYIERTVVNLTEYSFSKRRVYWDSLLEKGERIIDIIESNDSNSGKRVVLLSTAGYGKSEELKVIASYFSNEEKLIHPIYYVLRDYEGQEITDLLMQYDINWRNISNNNLILIFDGLDEITEVNFQKFLNNLNGFLELNPEINVLLSSRFNFYDITKQPLRGFEVFVLNPLTNKDIDVYITDKIGHKKEEFLGKLYEKNFIEYIDNPFYLTRLLRFYSELAKFFPNNKSELFERILFEQIEKDESKHNNSVEIKKVLLPIVQKVAFSMTVTGKSNLTDAEVELLIPEKEIRKQLKHFCILNRNSTVNGSWSFEHKSLQEYLCATVFVNRSFEAIHQIISFPFDNKKLIPKFLNTISFLFEIVSNDDKLFVKLFDWLNENEPELLIRFEKEQLSQSTRKQIFEKIYNYYKNRGLTLRVSSNFSLEELAYFVGIDKDVIDFIEYELAAGVNSIIASDLIWLISFCRRPYLYTDKIQRIILSVLNSKDYLSYVHSSGISALRELNIIDKSLFNKILDSPIELEDYDIRISIISYLYNSDFYEDYVDLIIDSIHIYEIKRKNQVIVSDTLKLLILKFTTPIAIKKVLQYCCTNRDTLSKYNYKRDFHFELEEVNTLVDKAKAAYKSDASILKCIYRIFVGLSHISHYEEWFDIYYSFFKETCGTRIIFDKYYKYHKSDKSEMMRFADKNCCDFLVKEYVNKNISHQDMIYLRNTFSWVNREFAMGYFTNELNKVSNNAFVVTIDENDYQEIQRQYVIRNQEMLLNQSLFLNEADAIFNTVGRDMITREEMWFLETPQLRVYQNSIAFKAIRDFRVYNKKDYVSQNEFTAVYRKAKKWNDFVIDAIVDLLEDTTMPQIDEKLVEMVKAYCINNVRNLDFKDCVKDTSPTSWSYIPIIEFTKKILLLLNLDLDDDLMVKMLPSYHEAYYDSEQNIGKYILTHVKNRQLLKDEVLKNIKNGNLARTVLHSHFIICKTERYYECLGDLYKAITSGEFGGYEKITLTKCYLDLGGEITDFSNYLIRPSTMDRNSIYTSWEWYLIEELKNKEEKKVRCILLDILENESEDRDNKVKACEQLIYMSDIEGLQYWAYYVERYSQMPFEHRWEFMSKYVIKMPTESVISILLKTLSHVYDNNIQSLLKFPDSIEEPIYGCLVAISSQDYMIYEDITLKLEEMSKLGYNEKHTYSIRYHLEALRKKFYENNTHIIGVSVSNDMYLKLVSSTIL